MENEIRVIIRYYCRSKMLAIDIRTPMPSLF